MTHTTGSSEDILRRILGRINDRDQREVLLDASDTADDVLTYANGVEDILNLLSNMIELPVNRDALYEIEIALNNNGFDIVDGFTTSDNTIGVNIMGMTRTVYIDVHIMKRLIAKYKGSIRPKPGYKNRYIIVVCVDALTLLRNAIQLR